MNRRDALRLGGIALGGAAVSRLPLLAQAGMHTAGAAAAPAGKADF